MPLSEVNVESELSYAYLHAVASKARMNCSVSNRHGDNYGVDALIEHFDKIPDTYITDVSFRIQLKATIKPQKMKKGFIPYFLDDVKMYDKLRSNVGTPHRILVVLFLPKEPNNWLKCTPSQLSMKKAAYWVCLYGAPNSDNASGVTVYLAKANLLTPNSLITLSHVAAKNSLPKYQLPPK